MGEEIQFTVWDLDPDTILNHQTNSSIWQKTADFEKKKLFYPRNTSKFIANNSNPKTDIRFILYQNWCD